MTAIAMKPQDAIWLMMETDDTPMHVGVLAIFEPPPNAKASYLGDMAQKMSQIEAVAPWSHRLARGLKPSLIEAQDFDLEYHLRRTALPKPGDERSLGELVSRLHSVALDRSRPLWEFHLIEGLDGGRFACYVKIHHALLEAVNGVPAVLAVLSKSAKSKSLPAIWAQPLPGAWSADVEQAKDEQYDDGVSPIVTDTIDTLSSLGRVTRGFLRGVFSSSEDNSYVLPRGTPRSTLNRRINCQRRFATQQVEQARIVKLAEATGSTSNEILTYLCGSSLRRFFKEYNALPEESLVAVIPVSLQNGASTDAGTGSAIAGLRVALGTHIGDPMARLKAVKASIKKVRIDRDSLPDDAIDSYVLLRAAPIYASQMPGIGKLVPPVFNLGVSNTEGSDVPLYFAGSRLQEIYPMTPLMQFSALSIDCVNYAGTLNIGFTGARDTLPHLQRMAIYFGNSLTDLEELVELKQSAS